MKNGVLHACLLTKGGKAQRGTIRVVNSAKECRKKKGEQALAWALLGAGGTAAGPTGPPGPAGPTGATGPQGPQGENGGGGVLETVKTQGKEIEVLLGKVGSLTTELTKLEGGLGGVESTVSGLGHTVNHSIEEVKTELNGTIGNLKTNVVDPLASKVTALEPLTGEVAALKTTTTTLTKQVASACSQLGVLTTAVNGVGSTTTKLIEVLKTVPLLSALGFPSSPTPLKEPYECP
ncbi:MAG: hypothetical protein JSU06_05795 [Actinobacteria bacterium]|nr:hypothetical protein [Actinomycetota bacterium]